MTSAFKAGGDNNPEKVPKKVQNILTTHPTLKS